VTGALGYVDAAVELMRQMAAGELPPPDVVYLALGSCGTAAGLWLGLAAGGLQTRVVGVRVVDRLVSNRRVTARLARATAGLLHRAGAAPPAPRDETLSVEHGWFGGLYGRPTPAAEAAVADAARGGLTLETTYTGKAFAALLADARAGRLDGRRVLFWNTFSSADLRPLLARSPGPPALPARLRKLF
jgi:D-cysteine desulfhydrase